MRRGPAPKRDDQRARRNKPDIEETILGRNPVGATPTLGRKGRGERWEPETREWFETWRRSPQASQLIATDWMMLRLLARLIDEYVKEPTPARMGEIRQNVQKWGATVDDRMRLKWRVNPHIPVGEPEEEPDTGRPRLRVAPDPRRRSA